MRDAKTSHDANHRALMETALKTETFASKRLEQINTVRMHLRAIQLSEIYIAHRTHVRRELQKGELGRFCVHHLNKLAKGDGNN